MTSSLRYSAFFSCSARFALYGASDIEDTPESRYQERM